MEEVFIETQIVRLVLEGETDAAKAKIADMTDNELRDYEKVISEVAKLAFTEAEKRGMWDPKPGDGPMGGPLGVLATGYTTDWGGFLDKDK